MLRFARVGCFAALAVTCIPTIASSADVRWRVSGAYTAGHSSSVAMETFKAEVEKLSNNSMRIDLFPGSTLGGGFEQVDQVRTNQVQMAWGGISFYDKVVPELAAAVLPFASASRAQASCQIGSDFGKLLEERSAAKNILIMGWGQGGARHVTNNVRPITSVDDMQGLKIRTPAGDAWTLTFRALGANPTPLDIKELYQGLQQGVVDGQENPYDNILVRNFAEVQKYLSNTGHFQDWIGFFVNKGAFDALSSENQEAVRQSMAKALEVQHEISTREEASSLKALIESGMEYHELSDADLDTFREATRSVYAAMRETLGAEVMDVAEAAIESCKSAQ